jgi:hypothetical protein
MENFSGTCKKRISEGKIEIKIKGNRNRNRKRKRTKKQGRIPKKRDRKEQVLHYRWPSLRLSRVVKHNVRFIPWVEQVHPTY